MNTEFDTAVLAIVKGCKIAKSIARLYEMGYLSDSELAACVGKYITLADYNKIKCID
jgi:hypothetical protein